MWLTTTAKAALRHRTIAPLCLGSYKYSTMSSTRQARFGCCLASCVIALALATLGCTDSSAKTPGRENEANHSPTDEDAHLPAGDDAIVNEDGHEPADQPDGNEAQPPDGGSSDAHPGYDATVLDAGSGDSGRTCEQHVFERCGICPQTCPPGQQWETYNCRCIIPGRCDNGWDLCGLDTPVCEDGKCVECASKDTKSCRSLNTGRRCDTDARKCVTECPTPCEPGTERDIFSCACLVPDPCDDGCPYWTPACHEGKCVECTSEQAVRCQGGRGCNTVAHVCTSS